MRLIEILRKNITYKLVIKIAAALVLLVLIIIAAFSCVKRNVKNNQDPGTAYSAPVSNTRSELNAAPEPLESTEEELPDLAEAIAHFSKETNIDPDRGAFIEDFWRWIFGEAGIPESIARKVADSAIESPAFIMELLALLQQDPYTYYLVDKRHPLPEAYEPDDLIPLESENIRLGRSGLMLRQIAYEALNEMATLASADGIVFTIGSTYRSAEYQAQVYEREVKTYGQETADRESAQPGKSQHQLGLVVDFSPIDDAFAETPEFKWLAANAGKFGWSLSFPDGYEEVTGYRYESWHYRYVGRDLAAFINTYFDGIQQYALQFIDAWLKQAGN